MSLIRFRDVSMRYDGNAVLRNVWFRLRRGERVGMIGQNGSGKTTVLRLILDQEQPTEGAVEVDAGVRIGYFSQFSELSGDVSVQQVCEEVFAEERAMEAELEEIEQAPAEGLPDSEQERLLERQTELLDEMERRDGWSYPTRIDTVLNKLGFSETYRHRPIGQLSGGWRNRASLARILLEAPDVLLLDEPTNFLDVEGLAWLEEWLRKWRGALLLVSHDRHFLDQVTNRIVEIENYRFQEYEGNYEAYVRDKQFRLKTLERQFQHEEELLLFEAEAIARRRRQAEEAAPGLRRKLADVKKRVAPRPVDKIITGVYEGLHVGEKLLRVEGISKAYDEQSLFRDLSFEAYRGNRLAVVGPNGCGKSTLLRVLLGEEAPDRGRVVWQGAAEAAWFNGMLASLPLDDTVTHAVNVIGLAYRAPRKQVNRFLELMRFSEMDLKQRIGTLSGGQRARVALAQCLLSGAGVVVLDEPTNHLDVPSIQVMERALVHFPGAVIFVSHDRFFIDKVATRLLAFDGAGGVAESHGNWTQRQAAQGG